MAAKTSTGSVLSKVKVSRPGVHSKTKSSKSKKSRNYRKSYKGQGR